MITNVKYFKQQSDISESFFKIHGEFYGKNQIQILHWQINFP